ncbi:MAG TPA: hypothetical protein VFV90_12535, partial [Usitatibacter sp.]|nr:hypothetical protein [Usitatibacter sp.]
TSTGGYFVLQTPPASPWGITAADTATVATVGNGTLSSSTDTSFYGLKYPSASGFIGNTAGSHVRIGSLSASYTGGSSFGGTFSYLPSGGETISTTFIAGSNQPASLSFFPRTWSGKFSYSETTGGNSSNWPSGTITIAANGALSGTVGCYGFPAVGAGGASCGITGTLAARTDMNAYDATFSLTETGGGIGITALRGKTFTGLAFYNAATSRFTMVGMSSDNTLLAFQN